MNGVAILGSELAIVLFNTAFIAIIAIIRFLFYEESVKTSAATICHKYPRPDVWIFSVVLVPSYDCFRVIIIVV